MSISTKQAAFIDELRDAAKEHEAVYKLLLVIDSGILIDEAGNRDVVATDDDCQLIRAAQITAAFAKTDRGEE